MGELDFDGFGGGGGVVVDEDLEVIMREVLIFRQVIFCLQFSLQGRTLFSFLYINLFNYQFFFFSLYSGGEFIYL